MITVVDRRYTSDNLLARLHEATCLLVGLLVSIDSLIGHCLKGQFSYKLKFCLPQVVSNLYNFIFSVEHERGYFEKCLCVFGYIQ